MAKLRFGTGGMPFTTNKAGGIKAGVARVAELGLQHMELEFVQQVFVKEADAPALKAAAEEHDVTLSVHGSYYVNLAAEEPEKLDASINRVISAAVRGDQAGAVSVTYHSGFMTGRDNAVVHELVKTGTRRILEEVKSKGTKIKISPELTGKPSQFGDLEDLIKLVAELKAEGFEDHIGFCFDFAHKYARSNGQFNSYDEVVKMIDQIGEGLGEKFLETMHIHMSAIEHSEKGEKNHLIYLPSLEAYAAAGVVVEGIEPFFNALHAKRLGENKFNWQAVMKALKDRNVGGYVVCESPVLELDALLMQKYYQEV